MCRAQENRFKYTNKNKNLAPLKMQFSPPNLKTWLRAWGQQWLNFSLLAENKEKQFSAKQKNTIEY